MNEFDKFDDTTYLHAMAWMAVQHVNGDPEYHYKRLTRIIGDGQRTEGGSSDGTPSSSHSDTTRRQECGPSMPNIGDTSTIEVKYAGKRNGVYAIVEIGGLLWNPQHDHFELPFGDEEEMEWKPAPLPTELGTHIIADIKDGVAGRELVLIGMVGTGHGRWFDIKTGLWAGGNEIENWKLK